MAALRSRSVCGRLTVSSARGCVWFLGYWGCPSRHSAHTNWGCGPPPEEQAELASALAELVGAFNRLVQVLLDGDQTQLSPQRIVDVAARVMPGCRHAAVLVIDADRPRTLASTDAVPDHVDGVQFDAGEGPSLDVLVTDDYVRVDDLADDPRWPQFASRAIQVAGIRSMINYRLYLGRQRRAALSFYSSWPFSRYERASLIVTNKVFGNHWTRHYAASIGSRGWGKSVRDIARRTADPAICHCVHGTLSMVSSPVIARTRPATRVGRMSSNWPPVVRSA